MIAGNIWRRTMYGVLGGLVLGLVLMLLGQTSPHPALCALQIAGLLACGAGGVLVVTYGPVRVLAWVFGLSRPNATWRDLAKRMAFFAMLASFGIAVLAAGGRDVARPEFVLIAWLLVVLNLMAVGPTTRNTPRRRWGLACCDALAAVYGPFVVAMVNTWLVDGTNTWLIAELWKHLPVIPGGAVLETASLAIWHQRIGETPVVYTSAAVLSATMVIVSAYLVAKVRRSRWIVLPLITGLCAWFALVLDAVMRM